jgi:hypothetical protein
MSKAPEIFFDYKFGDYHNDGTNLGYDFRILCYHRQEFPPPSDKLESEINSGFFDKLLYKDETFISRFIDYHYNAYKGEKKDFIIGVRNLYHTQRIGKREYFGLEYLASLERELNRESESETAPIISNAPPNPIRLTWNGQSNALIDMFRQLKTMVNDKREPLLADSYDDIATFLMNSFTNFEHTKRGTILTQLKTNNLVKNTNKRVTIDCKDSDSDQP